MQFFACKYISFFNSKSQNYFPDSCCMVLKVLLFCLLLLFAYTFSAQIYFYNQISEATSSANRSENSTQVEYSDDWDLSKKKTYWIDAYKTSKNKKNLLVYVPRPGGFGNIVRGLLTSYYLAVRSERYLAVERSSKYDLSSVLNFSNGEPFFYDKSSISALPVELYMDRHNTSTDFKKILSVSKSDAQIVKFVHRIGIYPNGDDGLVINREVLHRAIVPSNGLMLRYNETLKELGIEDGDYISVHARLGGGPDVREESNPRFAYLLDRIHTVAECLAVQSLIIARAQNVSAVYLATDTPRFKNIFATALKKFDNHTRVLVAPWEHTGHIQNSKAATAGSDQVVINTFAELLLIGNSRYFLHLPSTFAFLAQWMGSVSAMGILNTVNCSVQVSNTFSNESSERNTE